MNPDSIKSLEYSTVRVPCELLDAAFRLHHLSIGKYIHDIESIMRKFKNQCKRKRSDSSVKMVQVKDKFQKLIATINDLEKSFVNLGQQELAAANVLVNRLDHLEQVKSSVSDKSNWHSEQRFNRIIIDYLLRSGYAETAKKIAGRCNMENLCDIYVYEAARKVEESIKRHETAELLKWIMNYRSRLRRLKSELEIEARMQEIIEMLKSGKRLKAMMYAKTYFRKLPRSVWNPKLIRLMGFIGFGIGMRAHYEDFMSDERWHLLLNMFRAEFARVFQVNDSKTFNSCFCMGASSMRSPFCKPRSDAQCLTCLPHIFAETHDLPYAEAGKTELICQHCKCVIDQSNPLYMLPNGYCYCDKSIQELKRNSIIQCPKTDEIYLMAHVLPVYTII